MTIVVYNFFLKANIFLFKIDKLKTLIEEIESSGDVMTERSKKLMSAPVFIITGLSLILVGSFSVHAIFKGEMTIEAWMPFDPLKDRMSLILSAQILAILISPGLFRAFAMQGILCSMVIYLCDQLILLQVAIRNLKYTKDTQMEIRKKLKDVIKKHIRLMSYSRSMATIFKEYFLVQNLAVTLELCLNAVMVTVVRDVTILSFLAYLGLALINAYIYCYLGNELILQSRGIVLAAYEAPWTYWPIDMQKDLLLLITAAQKPMALSAGGVALVSLQTFGKTLYDGYSIFAVLNDMVD
ncbi:unnamed protein product [Arctia plantaginis]|uniref:Uncharacterized protein n=1 Tax=Arctia plantaginis TaxID=874455 RepID=A0A8S0Z437_ARCPL|nr:unnamed protein product [Arctia plantaginis]